MMATLFYLYNMTEDNRTFRIRDRMIILCYDASSVHEIILPQSFLDEHQDAEILVTSYNGKIEVSPSVLYYYDSTSNITAHMGNIGKWLRLHEINHNTSYKHVIFLSNMNDVPDIPEPSIQREDEVEITEDPEKRSYYVYYLLPDLIITSSINFKIICDIPRFGVSKHLEKSNMKNELSHDYSLYLTMQRLGMYIRLRNE